MAQQEWDVLVLETGKPSQYAGAVKASNQQDAKKKGTRLARGRGLTGLVEVRPSEPTGNSDYNIW